MAFSMTTLYYPLICVLLIVLVYVLRKNYKRSNEQIREFTRQHLTEIIRQMQEEEARNQGIAREDRRIRRKELTEEEKVARREFILTRVDVKVFNKSNCLSFMFLCEQQREICESKIEYL